MNKQQSHQKRNAGPYGAPTFRRVNCGRITPRTGISLSANALLARSRFLRVGGLR